MPKRQKNKAQEPQKQQETPKVDYREKYRDDFQEDFTEDFQGDFPENFPDSQGPSDYSLRNPANDIPFVEIKESRVDSKGKPYTATTNVRPQPGQGYDILTDDVLASGNLGVLYQFQIDHAAELDDPKNLPAKRYLEARIQTAEKLAEIETRTKKDAALGKRLPQQEPVVDKQGFVGFPGVPYSVQTSGNGCWSCAYSALLKSRGVGLTQEEIRAWRPDYPADTPAEEKADHSRRRVMNSDAANAIFPNSDLAAKVLPNTAVNQLKVEPFLDYMADGLSPDELAQTKAEYRAQAKQLLGDTIRDALVTHRSPVAIVWDGHYVTITGIREDGTVRFLDSLGSHDREQTMSLDQLAQQGLFAHRNYGSGIDYPEGGGMELVWLSDLPVPEYGSQEPPTLDPENQNYAKLHPDGSVTVNVPDAELLATAEGSKSQGQVDVTGVTQNLLLDQSRLNKKLVSFGWNEGFGLAQKSRYYPKRMTQLGDPQLTPIEQLKAHEKSFADGAELLTLNADHLVSTMDERDAFEACEKRLIPYRNAFQVLRNIAKGTASEAEKQRLPQALKALRGIGPALLGREEGSGLSNLSLIQRTQGKQAAENLVGTLEKLGEVWDLGFDPQSARKQLKTERETVQTVSYQDTTKRIWDRGVANLDRDGPDAERQRELCLARLIAADNLYNEAVREGAMAPNPSMEKIDELAFQIARTPAFRTMAAERSNELIQKFQYNNGAIGSVFAPTLGQYESKRVSQVENTERYAIGKNRIGRVRDRTNYLYEKLAKTGTGGISILGMGSISRSKNTPEFEAAKKAIQDFSNPKNPAPSAADVKKAADTVMTYLNGKEKVRYHQFGRERWYQCMCFLAEVMPQEKFQQYLDHVNQVRKATPDSPNYVGREDFYPDHATASFIIADSVKNVVNDRDSERSLARILATRSIVTDGTVVLLDDTFREADSRAHLRRQTDAVMADPRFRDFARKALWEIPRKELHTLLDKKGEGLEAAWEKHKELHPLESSAPEKAGTQPVKGPEKS